MTKIIFIEADGTEKEVDAQNGLSLLEVAHTNGISLEGACEGSLACSTCHIILEKNFFDKLPEPSEEEEDMLTSKLEQDEQLAMLFDKVVDVAQEFAGSGPVEGPGSGVSDSIPARLSDGEFVFTAKAVEEIGADNLMSMMKDAEAKADERQTAYDGGLMGDQLEKVVTTETRITKPADVMSPVLGAEEDNMIQEEVTRNMLDPRVPHVRS